MKYADATVGSTYKVHKATEHDLYYKHVDEGRWQPGSNPHYWGNRNEPPQNTELLKPRRGDYLECISIDPDLKATAYRLWRDGTATTTCVRTTRHGWIERSDKVLLGAASAEMTGRRRKAEADKVKGQIDKLTEQVEDHQKAVRKLNDQIGKLNARYRLLTEFDSDEAAVAHVLTNLKDADPQDIVERLKLSGVEIIV